MPDAATLALFVVASLALTLTPGPAVLYILARSVEGGRPAGLASALGVGAGGLVHAALAAVGLSALLASSATAFAVVKWLGAAYLVWLGLQRLLARDEEDASTAVEPARLSRVFLQGAIVDVLNPKVALFSSPFSRSLWTPSGGVAWSQVLALTFRSRQEERWTSG